MMKIQNFIVYLLCTLFAQQATFALVNTRSQSLDLPRYMVGWTNQTYLAKNKGRYGAIAFIPQYNHSLFNHAIATALFGEDSINTNRSDDITIGISGSQVGSRNRKDWLADYFGLPTDYQSVVSLKPKFSSFIFDIDFYLNFDCLCSNLFLWCRLPIVHARTTLQSTECVINPGVNSYAAGYFAPIAVPRSPLLPNFNHFIGYEQAPILDATDGIVFDPLEKNRFALPVNRTIDTTQLSDLYFVFGWTPLLRESGHLGFGAVVVVPTAPHIKNNFVFEPIVGNGHHWELGAYFTSRYGLWEGCDGYHSLIFSCDAIINHMFSTRQYRTLDLKNGASSRYMLAEKVTGPVGPYLYGTGADISSGPTAASIQPTAQFQNVYTPVANLTSAAVQVSYDLQAEVTPMFTYTTQHDSIAIDFGYDFWIRTKDKIKGCKGTMLGSGDWALKGDAYTYGFGATDAIIGANALIPLSATESMATIHAGTNTPINTDFSSLPTNNQTQNPGIDNPQFGVTSNVIADTTDYITISPGMTASAANQQRISLPPVLLSDCDLDWEREQQQAMSHKVFIHGSYTWPKSCGFWSPYIGFGTFAEFAFVGSKKHKNHSLSQGGIWMKTGLSF